MKKYLTLFLLAPLLFTSCQKQFTYRDISAFHIQPDALKDGKKVEIIYVSGGPDYNSEAKYYYHMIVVSEERKDTVNLLCLHLTNVEGANNMMNFISGEGDTYRILSQFARLPHPDKVVSNRKYHDVEENDYPAVIGTLGIITPPDSTTIPLQGL